MPQLAERQPHRKITPPQWAMVAVIVGGVAFGVYCNDYRLPWLHSITHIHSTEKSDVQKLATTPQTPTPPVYADLEKRLQAIRQHTETSK